MLDAYIIDRIKREKERQESGRESLTVEIPGNRPGNRPGRDRPDVDDRPNRREEKDTERGVVIIDFTI